MAFVYVQEKLPPELMQTLLQTNWAAYRNMPKPDIIVANDPDDARARFDLTNNDVITIITSGPEVIKYRGNVHYYDKAYPILLELWTRVDRQRVRDMWKQVKGIVFDHLFAIDGYQIIKIQSYTEMVNDALNIWRAQVKLSIEAAGVCIDTNGDYDRFNV